MRWEKSKESVEKYELKDNTGRSPPFAVSMILRFVDGALMEAEIQYGFTEKIILTSPAIKLVYLFVKQFEDKILHSYPELKEVKANE